MPAKIIAIEDREGPFKTIFNRVMRMAPDRDKNDKNLQRLIAFRLKADGEAATTEYMIRKIREIVKCAYRGSFYDFLKDDLKEKECGPPRTAPDPPEVA